MQHDRPDLPTMEQVEKANHEELARWYRFLPSGDTKEQQKIMDRIAEVRRHDSGPGEKDRFLSLILATVLLPLLRIFWISGLQQTLCL